MAKLSRTKVFRKHRIDSITENDLIANGWNTWEWSGVDALYEVKMTDVSRPDLVSQNVYGTSSYWWILMKYNKKDDVWNDLKAGDILSCPPKSEMDRFYNSISRRDELKS